MATAINPPIFNGILLIDKPPDVTSRDVVNRAVHCFNQKKIGHAGTLDPLASGLLILCLGSATRLVPAIQAQPKTYEATVTLGATSTTDDALGILTKTLTCPQPTPSEISHALSSFLGTSQQVPPQYSAVKIGGQRAYRLARAGQTVMLAAKEVTISKIKLIDYQFPAVRLATVVSKGTYIRSLARDLGEKLKTGAFLSNLHRTQIGDFKVEAAISCDDLAHTPVTALPNLLLPNLFVNTVSHRQTG